VVSPSPPVPPGHRLLQPPLGFQHHIGRMHRPEIMECGKTWISNLSHTLQIGMWLTY
jgi:hypothetical protein